VSLLGVIIGNGTTDLLPGNTAGTVTSGGNYDGVLQSPWQVVSKTSTQTVTNSTVMVSDTDLTFPMAANTNYRIRGVVFFDTTDAGDYKYSLIGPTSPVPTLVRMSRCHCIAGGTPGYIAIDTALPGVISMTGSGTNGGYIAFEAVVHNGSHAAAFAFSSPKIRIE
jgi:hypothetical protein